MTQEKQNLSAINKLVVTVIIVIAFAAVVANTIGIFKGEKPVMIASIFFALGILTSAFLIIQYKRNPASESLKYQAFFGFLILYCFALFSTDNNIVFIYIIPIIYLYTLYNDEKLITLVVSCFGTISFVSVFMLLFIKKINDGTHFMSYAVQIIASAVICVNAVLLTRLNKKINESNMQLLRDANKKQEDILGEVLAIGSILGDDSTKMSSIIDELSASSENMYQSLQKISTGIQYANQSIESQNSLTQAIQSIILTTCDKTNVMNTLSKTSFDSIKAGESLISKLTESSKSMENTGIQMGVSIQQLMQKMQQVNQITEVINTIADQINLLSLNASIESARAGEAGRGFSIVANEIGNLAAQTASSVSGITQIIDNLQSEMEHLINNGQEFGRLSSAHNTLIDETDKIFVQIADNMDKVNTEVADVTKEMENIKHSNHDIMNNIKRLHEHSDSSYDILAASDEAKEQMENHLLQTRVITEELLESSKRLQAYL